MIRHLVSMRLLLASVLGLAAVAAGVSPAAADPAITVSPTSSYAYDTFVFSGTGFPNGMTLTVTYTDPSGGTGNLADSYGTRTAVKVSSDGTWELRLQPGSALGGTGTGTYQLNFCQSDAPATCWSASLRVSNDVPGMSGGGMGGY